MYISVYFQSVFTKIMIFVNSDRCSRLPNSMTENNFEKGCPGAVLSNGDPSEQYCSGLDEDGSEAFPWWKDCCF